MKLGTQYFEGERALDHMRVSGFGLNPFALDILMRSYKANVAPMPASIMYEVQMTNPDKMDKAAKDKRRVEIHLSTPGFVGRVDYSKVRGGLDKFGLKLFARSYYENVRPKHIDFIYQGVEVHVRTPGIEESDHKNIARNLFNPTAEKGRAKKKHS